MDPQVVLDTALAAGATTLGAPEAAKIFRDQLKASMRVQVQLTSAQKSILKKMVTFPIIFFGQKVVTNDHPLLVACRDLIRDCFEQEYGVLNTNERTLIVGASAREIRKYNANPHIHYYIYGKENKDYDRIIRPALQDICSMLKNKASKTDKRVFLMPAAERETVKMRPVAKRYWLQQEILNDYMTTKKLPGTIHTTYVDANTLVMEDSFYNFGPDEYVDLFARTGAQVCYGYGLLPLELVWPELPENPVYSLTTRRDFLGRKMAYLVFRNGYCNGYVHDFDKWATLLKSPVITNRSRHHISLAVEITSRVGPMVTFKIYRCHHPERLVRSIDLEERQRYVKVLRISECVDRRTGKVKSPLKYFSMVESEYLDVVNYLLSLDQKSLTYQNTVAYIRRRMGGMSLISKELIEPWYLPKRLVGEAAMTILLEVKLKTVYRERILENLDVESIWGKFAAMFRVATRILFYPICLLIDWILAGHLSDKLVLDVEGTSIQYGEIKPMEAAKQEAMTVGLYLDNPYEGDIPTCPVCLELMGKMGDQIVRCGHVNADNVVLKMKDGELQDLRVTLMDSDMDPPGLAAVKKRCLENLPTSGFEHSVKVHYIRAGPGCGKSYLIRQLATTSDLVMAPFTKLKADYSELQGPDGERYNLLFKTTHRAMETRGNRRIFVDEFTSLPYEYLACVAYVNGAEEIFLVGDERQTKVQEPDEGRYIGNYIDLAKLSTHELLVNFRNPQDIVAVMNKAYGYEMRAASTIERSVEFVAMDDLPKDLVAVRMAFSKISAKANTEEEHNTVRANQGGTHKNSILFVTLADGQTPSVEELQIVGLTRHTEKLYIVTDGCDEAVKLREKLALDADFYEHMQTWLTFPTEQLQTVERSDILVDLVLKEPQPPKDMHLMVESMLPSAAFDDQTTSHNLVGSTQFSDAFITGKFDTDLLLMPVNKRRHPTSLAVSYFSIGCGVGNYFTERSPVQVLQVLQARYFNRQIYFEFGHKQRTLATNMVNMWFNEHVQEDFKKNLFDDAEITEVLHGFLKKVANQNYQKSFEGVGRNDNPDGRTIRFNLKGIFKPKHGEPDVLKAGQGISAWSVDACAMFCSIFRILTRLAVRTEKHHVCTDSYLTELQFINRVTAELKSVPEVAKFATTDGITFDANQNAFTQYIEKIYWQAYGVPEEFLEHYYSFRKNYKVISSIAVGFAGTQKTSGEPGTLVNNGLVSKIVSNFIVRGEGPVALVYKGDDFTKRQCNVQVNTANELAVNTACSLGLRVTIADSTDFCGLMFCDGALFPSIPRKANKIVAHRFRTYQHFCEYQTALRDWNALIGQIGTARVLGCNALHYETSFDEMEACHNFIVAMSHINKEQFAEMFQYRTETALIPVETPNGQDFVEQAGPSDFSEAPPIETARAITRMMRQGRMKAALARVPRT